LDGIIVSSHGGRRLTECGHDPGAEVDQAVKRPSEVYLDSGIRRGTDVLIALARRARAGRPMPGPWQRTGNEFKCIELLREEFLNAMVRRCAKVATSTAAVRQIMTIPHDCRRSATSLTVSVTLVPSKAKTWCITAFTEPDHGGRSQFAGGWLMLGSSAMVLTSVFRARWPSKVH
jgi:hypothetical protein